MSRAARLAAVGLACGLVVTARADAPGIDRLAWMAGCWQSRDAEAGSGEQWMRPAGGTMLGMSRTVRAGQTVEHEFMRIHATASGQLAFTAHPSGQATATFPLRTAGEREVVFENLQHDFPQRVAYRLAQADQLIGRIEGTRAGAVKAIEFPMSRVDCESGAARSGD